MKGNTIHPTAIIGQDVKMGSGNVVGPYCIIEGNINIGDNNQFLSHVVVRNTVDIGSGNLFYEFSSIGNRSQDKKCNADISLLSVKIGDENCFRESVTVHLGTGRDRFKTIIGNKNLLMANSHVAHDCIVKNNVVMANSVGLAGHVVVGNNAVIGGNAGVCQKLVIGDCAMIGGGTVIRKHVLPFSSASCSNDGDGVKNSLNTIGLSRNYSEDEILNVKKIFKNVVFKKDLTYNEKVEYVKNYNSTNQDLIKRAFDEFFDEVKESKFSIYLK